MTPHQEVDVLTIFKFKASLGCSLVAVLNCLLLGNLYTLVLYAYGIPIIPYVCIWYTNTDIDVHMHMYAYGIPI
jgi:hypothetical protein